MIFFSVRLSQSGCLNPGPPLHHPPEMNKQLHAINHARHNSCTVERFSCKVNGLEESELPYWKIVRQETGGRWAAPQVVSRPGGGAYCIRGEDEHKMLATYAKGGFDSAGRKCSTAQLSRGNPVLMDPKLGRCHCPLVLFLCWRVELQDLWCL